MPLLEKIDRPEDLRKLAPGALPSVAAAVRTHLIEVGARNGGHFAGSLGAVELSVALHYVFETPHDRVVWDIGHQGYAHKALTGRAEGLYKIKCADGPSGFLRRAESPYDTFGAGHAGTSVSAALGMAEGAAQRGEKRHAVAVIGDGGATSGMSFEALNHAGGIPNALRVVWNDNGMSIAPTIGGLAKTGRTRDYLESLGLRYLGPVDGHDLGALVPALERLRDAEGPAVLHIRTKKGAGYAPAEADPFGWHATAKFDRTTGQRAASSAPPTWTRAFADALIRLADRDDRVVAITAAMPDGTGLDRFGARHPRRTYDAGIAEQHAVTFAGGLACEGMRPVCAIYSTFLQRALDQVIHDIALQDLPVTFVLDRAGLVGGDGPTHHGALDLAYLRAVPNLVLAAPRDENELQHLLATAIESGRPFALRFPRGAAPGAALDPDPKPLPIGRGERLREGDDVTFVALGNTVATALTAAERLAECGLSAGVVDARFAKPLDAELLTEEALRTGRVVTIEDHARAAGFGSAVLELLADTAPGTLVRRLGLPDRFVEHGDVAEQWREAGIDAASVADGTRTWIEGARTGIDATAGPARRVRGA